jgi:hypothetical protein
MLRVAIWSAMSDFSSAMCFSYYHGSDLGCGMFHSSFSSSCARSSQLSLTLLL